MKNERRKPLGRSYLCLTIAWVLTLTFAVCNAQSQSNFQIPNIDGKGKTIILTFDDASQSHYSVVAPMLKKYSFGATFYVCEFSPDFADTTKYMNWRQIKALSDMGFEIGNHTWHHTTLKGLSDSAMKNEVGYIDKQCKLYKIPKPTSFCYPSYVVDSAIFPILKQYGYTNARVGGDRPWNPGKDNVLLVPCYTIKGNDAPYFYNAISQATKDNVIVFCIHGTPDTAHDFVSTPPEVLDAYLRYLHEHHFRVISMREYMRHKQ